MSPYWHTSHKAGLDSSIFLGNNSFSRLLLSMRRRFLSSKIHRAKVTQADLDYEGSITVDPVLLEAAGIHQYEQVDVLDISNGSRLTTYAIHGISGSGEICINGAAAKLVEPGDLVILVSYVDLTNEEIKNHVPRVVLVDSENAICEVVHQSLSVNQA